MVDTAESIRDTVLHPGQDEQLRNVKIYHPKQYAGDVVKDDPDKNRIIRPVRIKTTKNSPPA